MVQFTLFKGIPGIKLTIPRLRSSPDLIEKSKFIKATKMAPLKRIPNMEHLIPVPKADSVIMVEITPNSYKHNLNMFLSYEKIPTYRSFMFHTKVSALPINTTLGITNRIFMKYKLSAQVSATGT